MKLKRILKDPIIYFLLSINIGLAAAYFSHIITAETIVFTYYFQSIVLGLSYFFQMLTLKDYSVNDLSINNQPVEKSSQTKGCISFFFLFHYGFFHLGYLIFLTIFLDLNGKADVHFILTSIIAFAIGEVMLVVRTKMTYPNKIPNIGSMMFTPYLRIIPMHLFIMAGGFIGHHNPIVFSIFMILKIISDVIMHIVVNKTWKEKEETIQKPIIQI